MSTVWFRRWLIVIWALASLPVLAQSGCSLEQYQVADNQLAAAGTAWPTLYRHWQRHAACDDGGLAEGYSEAVVTLLLDKQQWSALKRITARDAAFQRWMLGHLDESVSLSDLEQLRAQTVSCRKPDQRLCHTLQQALANLHAGAALP